MARRTAVFVLLTAIALLVSTSHAFYIPHLTESDDAIESGTRDKRYTDYQENASAFCTGMCMFEERMTYSQCFDLCNWTGQGPSPWAKLDAAKSRSSASTGSGGGGSADKAASLMRTGMMRTGTGQRNRGRSRARAGGRKKGTQRSY